MKGFSEVDLQHFVNKLRGGHPAVPGFALAIVSFDGGCQAAANGVAAPDNRPFDPHTPVRTASVTKTLVAAALLRLWESGEVDLDASISTLVDPAYDAMLRGGGYDTNAITARHLAMHISGMADHFASDAFLGQVFDKPHHHWSRQEQLDLLVKDFVPLSEPGERYAYSDSGYVLLGHVIERLTAEPLPNAVRRLTKLDQIGLENSWWDALETAPAGAAERAHQYRDGADIYDIDGSMDAYGGGGLIASTVEMAQFFAALFSGQVFDHPATLDTMTQAPGHPEDSPYRIGLFHTDLSKVPAYSHAGYWGTNVIAAPTLNMAIAGTTLEKMASKALIDVMEDIVVSIASKRF